MGYEIGDIYTQFTLLDSLCQHILQLQPSLASLLNEVESKGVWGEGWWELEIQTYSS